jgi:hypothetical protein
MRTGWTRTVAPADPVQRDGQTRPIHGIGRAGLESRRPHYRYSQIRVKRVPNNRGWVACNDGPAFATQIAHWLALADIAT